MDDGADLDGLCAAFTTARLRVHDLRVDRAFLSILLSTQPL